VHRHVLVVAVWVCGVLLQHLHRPVLRHRELAVSSHPLLLVL
jgi:hypothetical protein